MFSNSNTWDNKHEERKKNNDDSNSNSSIATPIADVQRARPDTVANNYLVALEPGTLRFIRKKQIKVIQIILIILFFLLLTVLFINLHYIFNKPMQICETPECIRSATNLILSMDQTADPCEDFYQYACGNWHLSHPKPDFLSSYDRFSDKKINIKRKLRDILSTNTSKDDPLPFNQAKQMYAACINTEAMDAVGLKPLFDFLKSVNLPLIPTFLNMTKGVNYDTYKFDWMQSMVKIRKKIGVDVLIGFDIYPDPRNNSQRRLSLRKPFIVQSLLSGSSLTHNPPEWKRPLRNVMMGQDENKCNNGDKLDSDNNGIEDETNPEKQLYTQALKIILAKVNQSTVIEMNNKQINKNIRKTIGQYSEYTKKVFRLTYISNTTENESMEVFNSTVDKLQNATDELFTKENVGKLVIWKPYFQEMFKGTNVTLDFCKDTIIFESDNYAYSLQMALLIRKTPPVILELYIWIQVVATFLPHTISSIRLLHEQYMRSLIGLETLQPRTMECVDSVSTMMDFAVAYGIVDKKNLETTLPKVQNMWTHIKYSLEDLIVVSSWMDLPAKTVSIENVRNMKSLIGYPQWSLDKKKLEEHYKGLAVDPEKHVQNLLSIKEFDVLRKLNSYRAPYVFELYTESIEVNAYYDAGTNGIILPMMMLEYPFYDLGMEALNYGSIGSILGHELLHGFDNYGRQYDAKGVLIPRWTNKTVESYINRTECLSKQYSSFYLQKMDDYVDGNRTLKENIADNGGLSIALKGYWRESKERLTLPGLGHLSNEQLFFLSYGNLRCAIQTRESLSIVKFDSHSPQHIRVKGTLQNMPEFAEAFRCTANTTMNPNKRCHIF